MTSALEQLSDPVPLTYDADTQATLAADTVTGAPVDGSLEQKIIANIDLNGRSVPLMPVMSIDATLTQGSVADAAAAAASASTMLSLKCTFPRSARHRHSVHCVGRCSPTADTGGRCGTRRGGSSRSYVSSTTQQRRADGSA